MRIGIMQPYFFPYLGYFQLINLVDRFILFDDVQYIRHGWIARNRILKPSEGFQYIIMPLATHDQRTLIRDIKAQDGSEWKEKIMRQLEHYKKRAPYYKDVMQLLDKCWESKEESVAQLNGNYLKTICGYIGVNFKVEISSKMNFDYSGVNDAGEWALKISEQLGAAEYINPASGAELFDKAKFEKSGIQLTFIHPKLEAYSQRRESFEAGLSIIDVLMFNPLDKVREMLTNYTTS
jgi:hypothetical protein